MLEKLKYILIAKLLSGEIRIKIEFNNAHNKQLEEKNEILG